jgi:hypothetical protein
MNLLPVTQEPKLLISTPSSRIQDLKWTVDQIYRLADQRPLPIETITSLVNTLTLHGYKVAYSAPMPKSQASGTIIVQTLSPKELYIDPKLLWRPTPKQQELLFMLKTHPLPSTVRQDQLGPAKELAKLRAQLWTLYQQAAQR